MTKPIIGFIGTGVMGASMAAHLQNAGYALVVYNRTSTKAQPLLAQGATWADTPAEVAQKADIIFTMLGYPHDVQEVYLGEKGILAHGKSGQIYCDFTTSAPALAQNIAQIAMEQGISVLDAPVSGGDIGAREARLSIMCGGDEAAFQSILPLLEIMGKNIVYHGGAGTGQHAKMCNQITLCGMMMSVMEALAYAQKAGLDPEKMLQSVGGGAATSWTFQNLLPRVLRGDLNPGFYVEHFVKDMDIALEEAHKMGLELPALALTRQMYQRLVDMGHARLGTHALWLVYN